MPTLQSTALVNQQGGNAGQQDAYDHRSRGINSGIAKRWLAHSRPQQGRNDLDYFSV